MTSTFNVCCIPFMINNNKKMDAEKTERRESNFSQQECMLLAETMGKQTKTHPSLTYHELFRHRFTNGITSQTKKCMWREVCDIYNSNTVTARSSEKLEKKWLNMVAKHRLLYSDFIRDRALTGGGQCSKQLSLLTEAVMAVIGKESTAVAGAASTWMDTSFIQLQLLNESHTTSPMETTVNVLEEIDQPEVANISNTCACQCHKAKETEALETLSLEELKKRKIILQIQYYNKKLKM